MRLELSPPLNLAARKLLLQQLSGNKGPAKLGVSPVRRPGQAGSETGSSVGIAETTYLGFLEDKGSHIEVSGFCNQYKYALPTSDQDVRQEARGHCLLSIYLSVLVEIITMFGAL